MSQASNPFNSGSSKKTTCIEMLQVILDGQATIGQCEYFRLHMDQCMPCFKNYQLDIAIKEMLKTKCCGGEAPTELVSKIKSQIAQNIR